MNDNAPKFELPDYQAHNVDEDIPLETSILKVKATDADSGSNAEIEYLVADDHFNIDTNGVIRNNKQLDADNNNAYYEVIYYGWMHSDFISVTKLQSNHSTTGI